MTCLSKDEKCKKKTPKKTQQQQKGKNYPVEKD